MNIAEIKRSARFVTRSDGTTRVEISVAAWEAMLGLLDEQLQQTQLLAALDEIEAARDEMSQDWWADFDAELRHARTTFSDRTDV